MERLIRPLDIDNFVTSPGGRFLSRRGNVYHFASDYPVASGLPIYASNSGTLSDATNSQCGNGVQIVGDKNSPYITGYCHLEKFSPEIHIRISWFAVLWVKLELKTSEDGREIQFQRVWAKNNQKISKGGFEKLRREFQPYGEFPDIW